MLGWLIDSYCLAIIKVISPNETDYSKRFVAIDLSGESYHVTVSACYPNEVTADADAADVAVTAMITHP